MIVTSRCAKFLQSLPNDDATAVLDTVTSVAANPDAPSRHCKKLSANLWEARIQRPHRINYRVMFAFRPDGQLVVLSGCIKKSDAVHEKAIRTARAELTSDEPLEGAAMPYSTRTARKDTVAGRPIATRAPFDLKSPWIYDASGQQWRIAYMTRRKVVVETGSGRVTLNRARLEQDGQDVANGVAYRVSRYVLPIDTEIAS